MDDQRPRRPEHRAGEGPEAEGFRLEEFLPYRLSVTTNRISRAFAARYSERVGLSIPEWRVLAVLGSFAPLSSNEICERTAMDKAKVSRAVALLTGKGLVDRAAHPADLRLLRLSLSRRGRATYAAVIPIARAIEAEVTAGLSAQERVVLGRCLDRLGAAVARLEAGERDGTRAAGTRVGGTGAAGTGMAGAPLPGQAQIQEAAMTAKQRNEGEGNKSADRNYRERTEDFIEKNDVEQKAKEAAKDIRSPNQPLSAAEKIGRERAAELDPQVTGGGKKPR